MEEEKSQQTQSKYSTPFSQYQASIINITNPNDLIQVIEMNLRGLMVNSEGEVVPISKTAKPIINEEGIKAIISMVQSIISQNTVMSNLEKNEVKGIMQSLIFTLDLQLLLNKENWGIKDCEDRSRIAIMVLNPCYICLKRSFSEGEREFWKGAIGEYVHHTAQQGTARRSFWSRLNPWSKAEG